MKIIISRKGFDSGAGGCASPIFEDGSLMSLPIPDGRSKTKYRDLQGPCDVGKLVQDLSGHKVWGNYPAHLDPDLEHATLVERGDGWLPSLGQTGSAQSHLDANGVGPGDIFLFFGWFRDVERRDDKWRFKSKGRNLHAFFGFMQIKVVLRNVSEGSWSHYPWLDRHPHVNRAADPNNTIYVGSKELVLPGIGSTGIRGGGSVKQLSEVNTLTCSKAKNRSQWRLPLWMKPTEASCLSYHSSPDRWSHDENDLLLSAVARGQEFVLDCKDRHEASDWILRLLS